MFAVEDVDEMVTRHMVRSWLVKWFSIKILTGFAMFAQPTGCLSDWPSNLLSDYSFQQLLMNGKIY
jgi:hypothetical protein